MIRIVKQQPQQQPQNRIFYKNIFRSIDFCVLRDARHELFCVFGDFYASGTQDAEVTKSLDTLQIRKQMLSGFKS